MPLAGWRGPAVSSAGWPGQPASLPASWLAGPAQLASPPASGLAGQLAKLAQQVQASQPFRLAGTASWPSRLAS